VQASRSLRSLDLANATPLLQALGRLAGEAVPPDNKYQGSLPDTYHEYLVPLIFSAYADDIAKRVTVVEEAAVLETAAGTGVLTEYLAKTLPSDTKIVATDLNPAMLEVAERNLANFKNTTFEVANGVELPYSDASFDTVICQFGIMFFPDLAQGYREANRVLKRGGELIFNVWDTLDTNHLSRAVHESAIRLDLDNPPDFLKLPYAYNDIKAISTQLAEAGFPDISVNVLEKESGAKSAREVALALAVGSPLAAQLAERGLSDVAVDTIEADLISEFGDGEILAPMQAIVFHARSSS
jgi:ubiquinone/menaquinone biosynthesis C-methylase UbiE